ncbi:TlpA family protein disulfide reductase [Solitalea lacus]|uniref:TlpA family protein disulfide reductase n=1 Tax=Solitalea lacus TaxID=2911172 RepID=UPI001EDC8B33|nr:TlpA disulfide reductase family protein [Solitalea lacus]UKJ08823.1 TlpA family protein disulfide reductase [Solitalea lacus]
MRQLLLSFILFTCAYTVAHAQIATIELNVRNAKNDDVTISIPINHNYFAGNERHAKISNSGTLSIPLKEDETGPITIKVLDKKAFLYVQKGNSIKISLDTANKTNPWQFEGSNATGQHFLTENFLPKGRYVSPIMYEGYQYLTDSAAVDVEEKINRRRLSTFAEEEKLFNQFQIDTTFFNYLKISTNYYFAGITAYAIVHQFRKQELPKNHKLYQSSLPSDFEALWHKTYQLYPPNSFSATQMLWVFDYYYTYLVKYKHYLIKKSGQNPPSERENDDLKRIGNTINSEFKDHAAEYALANIIYSDANSKLYQSALIELFNDFKRQFPYSKYAPLIQPLIEDVIAFQIKAKAKYASGEKIGSKYSQINTLKELTDQFKGKTILIDTWATWCGPCKAEFQYTKELKKFLNEKDVTMLYISIDEDKYDTRWKEMIKYYELEGTHVRANKELQNDINKLIWDGNGYSVPTYIIIDKQGNIAEKKAYRPSQKELLFEQISKHL